MFILYIYNELKINIMEHINDKRKFKRTEKQDNPISTSIDLNKNKDFDIDHKTIKEKQQNS